jgi:hypothetical protein
MILTDGLDLSALTVENLKPVDIIACREFVRDAERRWWTDHECFNQWEWIKGETMEFNVGDKVVRDNGMSRKNIGTIIRITEKRKDVIVDFGSYKLIYNMNGWEKNCDIWARSYIKLLTPEIEEEIRQTEIIKKCRIVFDKKKITADQAERILAILLEDES